MEAILDFSASPVIYGIRGIYYCFLDVIFGKRVMSITDILFTFLFGVCLPSWDVFSDIGMAYFLISRNYLEYGIGESYESFDYKRALVKYQSQSKVIKVML